MSLQNTKTHMFYGPYDSRHIDSETVNYNWQEYLKSSKHYKEFFGKITGDNEVSKYDLLKLENDYNNSIKTNALKQTVEREMV